MKKLLAVAALAAASWAGSAFGADALLIRHEVVQMKVGEKTELRPGFFIGKATATDGSVAAADMDNAHRSVTIEGRTAGRTLITAWNRLEPNKRVELEIVVANDGWSVPTASAHEAPAPLEEPAATTTTEATKAED